MSHIAQLVPHPTSSLNLQPRADRFPRFPLKVWEPGNRFRRFREPVPERELAELGRRAEVGGSKATGAPRSAPKRSETRGWGTVNATICPIPGTGRGLAMTFNIERVPFPIDFLRFPFLKPSCDFDTLCCHVEGPPSGSLVCPTRSRSPSISASFRRLAAALLDYPIQLKGEKNRCFLSTGAMKAAATLGESPK